jgi:hypothetical protein
MFLLLSKEFLFRPTTCLAIKALPANPRPGRLLVFRLNRLLSLT